MRHRWDYGPAGSYASKRRTCGRCGMQQRAFGAGAGRHWEWRPGDEEPWRSGTAPECVGRPRPLILVDVDGPVNVTASAAVRRSRCYHEGWRQHRIEDFAARIFWNPEIGPWLLRLAAETGAELAWGSMWEDDANAYISPLLGLPRLPVSPAMSGITKAHGIVPWTAGRPFVWFDDEPGETGDVPRLAGDQPHLVILVSEYTGLTAEHIGQARAWLLRLREDS